MSIKFDYTAVVQRFSARFPVLSYIMTQIGFWVSANILLGAIIHLQTLSITHNAKLPMPGNFLPTIIIGSIAGILYGGCYGLIDYYFDKNIFRKKSLGKIILLKTVTSLVLLALILMFIRYILFYLFIPHPVDNANFSLKGISWKYLVYTVVIFYFFMTLLINFINQVNKKYGPGVLIPLLLGKYRNPQEEERIFMFMDLKSSTAVAERLGHLEYSSFIRDSFMDINQVLSPFNAEVYQYVGDEIILTWRVNDGLNHESCVRFFFACEKQFINRIEYYTKRYNLLPNFKASLHMGKVTAVEIGEIKRDIAYHGDTLNTAARIQSVCNDYDKKLLISEYLLEKIDSNIHLTAEALGMIQLKGKTKKIGIASIAWVE
ncbi:MAG: adenylate/guanylate cyclase domain-containing protein [Ginsengibacter sp.]